MDSDQIIQAALHHIDANIGGNWTVPSLAESVGYSPHHFNRLFSGTVGMPAMAYTTWRKLQFALYDLSCGKKVLDTAMEYGFETHAGFTKAFKRCFGYPPSLCYLRVKPKQPMNPTLESIKHQLLGGKPMHPHIFEFTPFSVVGFPTRHAMPAVQHTYDIPAFWDTIKLDDVENITLLHRSFQKSKHFEVYLCYDADPSTGAFTYLGGRGIDQPTDLENLTPDMTKVDIAGGLYAVFTTPPADDYAQAIASTWNEILQNWLPNSEFEFDETRRDFEYYDHRCHRWYFGGLKQMDICIPIRQREEEIKKSQARFK